MKLNKALFVAALAAGALFAFGPSSQAADSTNTPPPAMKGRGDFAKALDLTDDQKPKFDAIMKDAMAKRHALREDTSLSAEDKKAKAKAIQEETNAKMKELLTPEQYAKYEKMAQGMRRNGPPGGGEKPKESKD